MANSNYLLTAIRTEYTIQLVNILTPAIYEGINSIYSEVKKIAKDGEELKIFQGFLAKIPQWSEQMVAMEATRIKTVTPNADIIDDLIKAVIQSNILLLTSTDLADKQKVLKEFNLTLNYNKFVHNVYIEVAKTFYNYPFLFFHKVPALEYKKSQLKAHKLIKEAIEEAIRKMLPLQLILKKYLGIMSEMNDDKYLKSLVNTDNNKNQYQLTTSKNEINVGSDSDSEKEKQKNQLGGVVQSQPPISLKEIYEQQKKAGLNSTSVKHLPLTETRGTERKNDLVKSDRKINIVIPNSVKQPNFGKNKNESETSQAYANQDGGIEEEFSNSGKDKRGNGNGNGMNNYKPSLNTVSEGESADSNKKNHFANRFY
jgi:hypothetical protein